MTLQELPLLVGAKQIAGYFYGNPNMHRKIYNLYGQHAEPSRFPIFKTGAKLCARKSEIDNWIADREKASSGDRGGELDAA